MQSKFYAVLLGLVGLWSVSANSATVAIDFEEFALGEEAPLFSKGYTIEAEGVDFTAGFPCCNGLVLNYSGSNKLVVDSFANNDFMPQPRISIDVMRTDGSAFALYSIDIDGYSSTTGAAFNEIYGVRADGQHIVGTIADLGAGDWLAIASFSLYEEACVCGRFGAELSVEIDNIVLGAAVPVPAAVWLFASALAGLGWMRRKPTV